MEFDYRNTNRELLNNLYNLSILIPSYGNEQYIEQTIASLYNQSFKPNGAEIIIGVDGDHSLLEKVIDIRKDNRETYDFKIFYCPENKGLFTMKNTLLKVRNQSNDVLWFDSDDVMNKELLYKLNNLPSSARPILNIRLYAVIYNSYFCLISIYCH